MISVKIMYIIQMNYKNCELQDVKEFLFVRSEE